jgi:hypothetical protein
MRGVLKNLGVLAFVLAVGVVGHAQEGYGKGSWLFQKCQAYVRTIDNPNGGSDSDNQDGARCFDYLKGFVDGIMDHSPQPFCPGSATTGTTVRIYVNYMQQHPKLLDDSKTVGILQAFKEAYPCKTK